MQLGIVGLPNAGKSTLFNMLTGSEADTDIYPFTTVDRNIGRVAVPDERLAPLASVLGSSKAVPTSVSIVDIAGLVPGASEGEGLGNRFLGHIREVDAIAHVLRAFHSQQVTGTSEGVDPVRDLEIVRQELVIADLQSVSKKLEDVRIEAKSNAPDVLERLRTLEMIKERLESGQYLYFHRGQLSDKEWSEAKQLHLLTVLPVLYVLNIDEDIYVGDAPWLKKLTQNVGVSESQVVRVSAKFESELMDFTQEERELFLDDAGISRPGRERFLQTAHEVLGLLTYFTGNERETRAWSLPRGKTALKAAGKIHSDMAAGFIKGEIINADILIEIGSRERARSQGRTRVVGKDYEMQDGDVMEVHFRS